MTRSATDDDSAPTRIVLVRHGESNTTVRRVVGGHRTCDGLSELGRRQAERLGARLAETGEIRADRLLSSHYARAIETAEVLAPVLDLPVEVEPGFGELDPGPELDGIGFADYVERFGMPDWDDPDAELFPGGETTTRFQRRVDAAVTTVLRADVGRTVVVACHGGVVDAVFRKLVGAPATGVFDLYTLNTSITELVVTPTGRWQLSRYNDAAHLEGLPAETPRSPAG